MRFTFVQTLQVLLDTTQLYYYFFHKTPHMAIKRVLMILGASPEFHRRNNPEMMERPSDNVEVPQLMKRLPQLNEKNKERPLCFIYSIKARALLHAHLSRMPLPPNTLDEDRFAIVCCFFSFFFNSVASICCCANNFQLNQVKTYLISVRPIDGNSCFL